MKEYTMHDLIGDVIAGRFERGFAMFDYDEKNIVIDREAYAQYIPDLIRSLDGKRGDSLYKADILLMEIVPDEPDAATVNALIEKLHFKPHQVVLSKLLARISMPEDVNFQPLFKLFENGDNYRIELIRALKNVAHPETETVVLHELRKGVMRSAEEIKVITETLTSQGTMRSIPVLVAVSQDYVSMDVRSYFTDAMRAICEKTAVPKEIQGELIDPANWRMTWGGTPETFADFVEFISMFMVSGPGGKDMSILVGEIFMKEMRVDISPYESFEALKLCTSPDHMIEGMTNLKDSLENQYLLGALMDETGINPSSETMVQEMYFDLMNDYLMMRLRRHFIFPEDQ